MANLIPFGSSTGLSPRAERQLATEIATTHARGSLMAAREVAKIEAITEPGSGALEGFDVRGRR